MRDIEKWEKGYLEAYNYFLKYSNLLVPYNYITDSGYHLGSFIVNQRNAYKGTGTAKYDEERITKLEEIGMVWDVPKNALLTKTLNKRRQEQLLRRFKKFLEDKKGIFKSIDDVWYINELFVDEELTIKKKIK